MFEARPKPTRPNVVLGLAYGYGVEELVPFLISFCEHSENTRLHLFVDDKVECVLSNFRDPKVGFTNVSAYQDTCRIFGMRPETARLFLYRDFLQKSGLLFESVLLCDVRDLIFQGDLFAEDGFGNAVHFAIEDKAIGECDLNRLWINQAFGEEIAQTMCQYPILCSGTTFGRIQAVNAYLDAMCHEIRTRPMTSFDFVGIDQGVHNYVARNVPIGSVEIPENHCCISTLHYTSTNRASFIKWCRSCGRRQDASDRPSNTIVILI